MADEQITTAITPKPITLDAPAATLAVTNTPMPTRRLFGRRKIFTDHAKIDKTNIVAVLELALLEHWLNAIDCEYLYCYKKGMQPILDRVKTVRPEINERFVMNIAYEIVEEKSAYLFAKPLQYVIKDGNEKKIRFLKKFKDDLDINGKESQDPELAEWRSTVGTSYRMSLPNPNYTDGKNDEPIANCYVLDPRSAFVVYHNDIGQTPVLAVKFIIRRDGTRVYNCYTATHHYKIGETKSDKVDDKNEPIIIREINGTAVEHNLGVLPIVEYPNNRDLMSDIEYTIGLTDAINSVASDRVNGVTQFIQALMVLKGWKLSDEDYKQLLERGKNGLVCLPPSVQAGNDPDLKYLVENLDQKSIQTLQEDMRQIVLEIQGIPNRQAKASSTSDNVGAVQFRDGWETAGSRARKSQQMFNKSERLWVKLVLQILRTRTKLDLNLKDIEIKYVVQNYGNIAIKAQAAKMLVETGIYHPQTIHEVCEITTDPETSYKMGMTWFDKESEKEKGGSGNGSTDDGNKVDGTAGGSNNVNP